MMPKNILKNFLTSLNENQINSLKGFVRNNEYLESLITNLKSDETKIILLKYMMKRKEFSNSHEQCHLLMPMIKSTTNIYHSLDVSPEQVKMAEKIEISIPKKIDIKQETAPKKELPEDKQTPLPTRKDHR
jgi:hypothetical protein